MALQHIKQFQSAFDWEKFAAATGNTYKVVSVRPYTDKKGRLPDGLNLTLMVMHDSHDYGVDSNGVPRENNQYQSFNATVLNTQRKVVKGDMVKLLDYDSEHSYYIDFKLFLRFRDCERVQPTPKA